MTVVRLLLTLLLILCAGVSLPLNITRAQSQSAFRTGVDLVQLDVVVLDRNRQPVTGLTAADFTITEEGQSREIQAFAAITLPGPAPATGAAAWTRDVAPDVATNAIPDEGRLAVIMLDHAIPAGAMTVTAKAIARATVDALGQNDLAAVVRSTPIAGEGLSQNFTANRALLKEAIDSPFMGLTNGPPNGPTLGVDKVPSIDGESPYCPCGVCQWYAMERIANALSEVVGRHKAFFFIGRQILVNEAPTPDPKNTCDVLVADARDRTLRALDRANMTVHSLDPSGLETLAATASGGRRLGGPANLERQSNLGVLPAYTGGRVVLNTNAPESFLPEIFNESSAYYLIGFARSDDGRPGIRRNIRIRVNRPSVTVRNRVGYYPPSTAATEDAPVDPTTAALTDLLPKKDLPLTLGLTPRFQPDGTPHVAVLLGLDSAPPESEQQKASFFDVTIGVFDSKARMKGAERQTIEVPAPTLAAAARPVETLTHISLDPDRYELRVAITDVATETTGTVHGYVTVPEDDESVALSGILLERSGAPTLLRTFPRTDAVTASIQVRRKAGSTAAIPLTVRVVDTQNRAAFESVTTLDDGAFAGTRVADMRVNLPLADLEPGDYLLTVTGADGPGARRLRFQVR
ncbi:MAG: VWA domain-containing protein [Acidobacteria bacterium]|nr:VWA domain-containing protein [Acidobacteriota bacterium]